MEGREVTTDDAVVIRRVPKGDEDDIQSAYLRIGRVGQLWHSQNSEV